MHLNNISSGHLVIHCGEKNVCIKKNILIHCSNLIKSFKNSDINLNKEKCVMTTIDNIIKTKTLGLVHFKNLKLLKYL